MRITGKFCLTVIFLLLFLGSVKAEVLDRIVANVNGHIILYSELHDQIRVLEKVSPDVKTDDPDRKAKIERDVLGQMIRDRLTEDEVKRLKIAISDREIDTAVENIERENRVTGAQLEHLLKQEGSTLAQLRSDIKKQLERKRLLDRVLKSKIVISEAQVDAYLKSGKVNREERPRLAIIFLPVSGAAGGKEAEESERQARSILQRLKAGEDFAKMARQYSKGPAVEEGGDIGFIALNELAPAIGSAVRGLKANDITDLVKSGGGYYIVKVLDLQKEGQGSTDSTSREKVHKQLFQEELNRKFEAWVRELESRSFIQISL